MLIPKICPRCQKADRWRRIWMMPSRRIGGRVRINVCVRNDFAGWKWIHTCRCGHCGYRGRYDNEPETLGF